MTCGWSFGALVALHEAVADPAVSALALVGLPLGDAGLELPDPPSPPSSAPSAGRYSWSRGRAIRSRSVPTSREWRGACRVPSSVIVPGTDHFFWRREAEVASAVADFGERVLG